MKYYFLNEDRIIETDELIDKYGTNQPIAQLGIYELTEQPTWTPVGYVRTATGEYYPAKPLGVLQLEAVQYMIDNSMSPTQAKAHIQSGYVLC